jgi:hypothetical protein
VHPSFGVLMPLRRGNGMKGEAGYGAHDKRRVMG